MLLLLLATWQDVQRAWPRVRSPTQPPDNLPIEWYPLCTRIQAYWLPKLITTSDGNGMGAGKRLSLALMRRPHGTFNVTQRR